MATTLTGTSITTGTSAPASPNVSDMWFDTTSSVDAMKVYNGTAWATMSNKFTASGGTITQSGGFTIHTFTSSGTFTPNTIGTVEYLVIAGGGGSGTSGGGGGGAGGYRTATGFSVAATGLTVTVGAGGAENTNGANSVFSTITSIGGGRGSAGGSVTASIGGSGGGGGRDNVASAAGT